MQSVSDGAFGMTFQFLFSGENIRTTSPAKLTESSKELDSSKK